METKQFSQLAITSFLWGILLPIIFFIAVSTSSLLPSMIKNALFPTFVELLGLPFILITGIFLAWIALVRIARYNQRGKWLALATLLIDLCFFIILLTIAVMNWKLLFQTLNI